MWRSRVLQVVLFTALLLGSIVNSAAEIKSKSDAEAFFNLAEAEARRSCASPRARELYARAKKLGRTCSELYFSLGNCERESLPELETLSRSRRRRT